LVGKNVDRGKDRRSSSISEPRKIAWYTPEMTTNSLPYSELSDRDLITAVHHLAAAERGATAQLIASLAELDARRLYLAESYSSLFTYCTQVLHLSEHAAYGRIEAARAARRYPVLLERLGAGDMTLTAIGLLAPHLTTDNHQHLIDVSRHKSKREIEHLVATLRPQPPVPSAVRKLPEPLPRRVDSTVPIATAAPPLPPMPASLAEPPMTEREVRRAVVKSLDDERYKVQFTVMRATFEKLRRVQDLMRHTCPNGDVGVVFERALMTLLEHLERTKSAQVTRPRQQRGATARSRHIPATVRRAVWERDNAQCAFVGTRGRCTERGFLEFHHIVPFADGGLATVENIQLRCRAHNQYESDQWFGGGDPCIERERGNCADWITTRPGPSCAASAPLCETNEA
jgi:5-methylcytosine-specific restriction endonuclease McrA